MFLFDILFPWCSSFYSFLFIWWLRERIWRWVLVSVYCIALIICLITSFEFYLHLIELVNLWATILTYPLNLVCWVVMLSTLIPWRLCWCSHPSISLIRSALPCLPHNFVCCKCCVSFPIYALLHTFCVLNDFGEWGCHVCAPCI